jgi:hypothetical protein
MTTISPILKPIGHMLAAAERAQADSTPIVFRTCAWCGCGLGTKAAELPQAGTISHTICNPCRETFMKQTKNLPRPSCRPTPEVRR